MENESQFENSGEETQENVNSFVAEGKRGIDSDFDQDRARNCDSLVTNASKNGALATKFSELLASWGFVSCRCKESRFHQTAEGYSRN